MGMIRGSLVAISMGLSFSLLGCEGVSTFQSANPAIAANTQSIPPGLTVSQASWNKFLGCYREVTIDGASERLGTAKIERGEGQVWGQVYDINSAKPIPSIIITLSRPNTENYYSPVDISVFTDRGHFTSDKNGDHYRFHGEIEDELDGVEQKLGFHAQVDIKPLDNGNLEISFNRFVDKTQRPDLYDAKATATLQPMDCCDPSATACDPINN
jgi:hypothetical protein